MQPLYLQPWELRDISISFVLIFDWFVLSLLELKSDTLLPYFISYTPTGSYKPQISVETRPASRKY